MSFIKSFTIDAENKNYFPFNIPAVQFAKNIQLNKNITIFVGDNGCGKSTLLESLALKLSLPLIGGHIKHNNKTGFEAAEEIEDSLTIDWLREVKIGFFFRAEDFSDFINSVENDQKKIALDLQELKGNVPDHVIEEMSNGMNYSLNQMKKNYGSNMQAFSHGEAFLKILQKRIGNKGIFLLDEPEAALSPLKQLSLIFLIQEICKKQNAQFIIATHSPILMGIPNATIYEIEEDTMKEVVYQETNHYRITKTFLDNPDFYLRHL
jgi:predicted ATPase